MNIFLRYLTAVVELPPDGTLQTQDLAFFREIADAKLQSYFYSKSLVRTDSVRSNKHRSRNRRSRPNIIRYLHKCEFVNITQM